MICKEDFCAVFKDLHSAERVDLMCGLLQLCVPLELRFLGSHLEELARKDYAILRKYEIVSNDLSSLKVATETDSVDALNIYLSLLHSDNTTCAHVLFGVLSRLEQAVEMRVMSKSAAGFVLEQDSQLTDVDNNVDLILDLVLLFTMAVHHPAFTYSQRQQLYTSCKKIEKLLNYIPSYKLINGCGHSSSSVALASSVTDDSCDSNSPLRCCSSSTVDSWPPSSEQFVRSIKLQKCDRSSNPKVHDYYLEVSWSDGAVTDTVKHYHELQSFHAEMLRLFPKESGAHKQERSIPFLPQEHVPPYPAHKMNESMKVYFRKLSSMPDYIVQCEHMSAFFRCPVSSSLNASTSSSSLSVSGRRSLPAKPCVENGWPGSSTGTSRSAFSTQSAVVTAEALCAAAAVGMNIRPQAPVVTMHTSASMPESVGRPLRPWVKITSSTVNGLRPGLCSAASELSCVTVSSSSLGSVVSAVVHPTAPPPSATKTHSCDDTRQSSSDVVAIETVSNFTDNSAEHTAGDDRLQRQHLIPDAHSYHSLIDPAIAAIQHVASDEQQMMQYSAGPAADMTEVINRQVRYAAGSVSSPGVSDVVSERDMLMETTCQPAGDVALPEPADDEDMEHGQSCSNTDIPTASSRDIFGWPAVFAGDPACQGTMILPISANGDLSLSYIDQAVPCISASNFNNNQHPYVHSVLPESAEPMQVQCPPQQHMTASSVHRVARPILGAAANHGLPPGSLDRTGTANMPNDTTSSKGVVGATAAMTVDIIPQPPRPPSNSENIPNGRHWTPAADSPSGMRSASVVPPSSSPSLIQQQLSSDNAATNPSHQFVAQPYCYITPLTTVPTGPSTSGSTAVVQAAGSPVPNANLCTAGCCHCGQCPPPVGAYAYAYPHFMLPGTAPFLPGFSYAIPGLPFPPPSLPPVSYSGTYTQSSDLMYNNQQVFTPMHQFQRPPPPVQAPMPLPPNTGRGPPLKPSPVVTVPFNPMMPPPSAHVANPTGRRNGSKNSACFNCGLIGHHATACPEPLMSSSANTGQFRLNCMPKVTKTDDGAHRSSV